MTQVFQFLGSASGFRRLRLWEYGLSVYGSGAGYFVGYLGFWTAFTLFGYQNG
jgi:hypothetical protein